MLAARNSFLAGSLPTGQQAFTTAGTYSWTAPFGVYSVSVVCVGGGGAAVLGSVVGALDIGAAPGPLKRPSPWTSSSLTS